MATVYRDPSAAVDDPPSQHIYSVCFFAGGLVVPDVELVEAGNDDEAVDFARAKRLFTMREVWDRHRLVAVIPAAQ